MNERRTLRGHARQLRSKLRRSLQRATRAGRLWSDGVLGPVPAPQRWAFIVGCYNSGTTLLHQLLAEHPDVGSMPNEGQFFTDELPLPRDLGMPRAWALDADRFRLTELSTAPINVLRLKRHWGARFNHVDRPVLIEKSPTNAARTRWLEKHFENAHFIGIIRNGYAVAEGIRRKAGHNLEDAARQWAVSNEIMLADFECLTRTHVVRYEELAADPERVTRALCAFLGLDEGRLSLGGRKWHVHEQVSEVKDMNERSFSRLTAAERAQVEAVAGPMLERLGYLHGGGPRRQ